MTNQVATVTGVPQTVVNATIESKTGVQTGDSIGDQVTGMFGNKEKNEKNEKNEEGEKGDVEMVAIEIKTEDEVKVADPADPAQDGESESAGPQPEITSEQAALLGQFRAPKQPEEYWYENHLCLFKFMFIMCALNIVLALITMLYPF